VVIVCHEKVVKISLEGDEILRVQGERTQGVAKTLLNTKFRIDLVPGAMPVAKSPYRLAPSEMQALSEQLQELQEKGKANVVIDALSRKERVKPRRVRAMTMTIHYGVRGLILAAQSEAFKQENILAERLRGLDQQMGRKEDESFKEWSSGVDHLRLRWEIYFVVLADAAESVRDAIGFEYCLASSSGWTKSPVLWAEIGESSLIGLELVQETTDKVTPWKGVVHFGKKGKLAPRYVGPFEILERIGLVAYRLRLPEELSSVHDTFHVSNLKKCLTDANLHVPLDEIKVDKTLCFVEEPIEIMDREIKKLKHRKIALVKVRWNSKRGPEFTWEHEDQMRIRYPQLFVDRVIEPASKISGRDFLKEGIL
ncbi:hypothetical protein Tco_0519727, partial [Tanacetum coccineum]